MKVLVTGGTGVVGAAAVRHLLQGGHSVRLFTSRVERERAQWPAGVELYQRDIADPASVQGSAEGCGAVLHLAAIVTESPPEITFQRINVEGTRHALAEATRAAVENFVYLSSLGAERGSSGYHQSMRRGEELVRAFAAEWLICRSGYVYGPGDKLVSLLLTLVRTLPAIPVVDGDIPFQPVWAEDLGRALALAVERTDVRRQVLELAGLETVTLQHVLDHVQRLTDKSPARVPLPGWLASVGARVASAAGIELALSPDRIAALLEGNVIGPGRRNALVEVFGVSPAPLAQGLAMLADSMPEQLPSEGVGRLHQRRYWADVFGSRFSPDQLMELFRARFAALMPKSMAKIGAEPGTPTTLQEGATLTMALRGRGNVQVRVEEIADGAITFVTLEGHPLAGAIRFLFEKRGEALRFEVQTYDRAANELDRVMLSTLGRVLKFATWAELVEAVVRESGGEAPEGVQSERKVLDGAEADRVERMIEDIVTRRKREELQ